MRAVLHAEWTKLRTVASTGWLLAGLVVLTVAAGAATAGVTRCAGATACAGDPARISLTGIYLGQAVAAVAAVLTIGGEYGTGMIRLTLTATPRRGLLLAAKAVTLTGPMLAAGALAVGLSLLAGRLILPGHGVGPAPSPADGAVLRAAAGGVLYLALIGLLSLGVATLVRDAAAAIGIVLGLLYLFPIIAAAAGDPHLSRHIDQIGPMTAGLAVLATKNVPALPIGPWAGLGVLAGWAAAALAAGGLAFRLRDA